MLTLFAAALIGIISAIIFLVVIDAESPVKVPFFHYRKSIVSWFTKWCFKSDLISSTIGRIRKSWELSISNICRLAK